MRAKSDFTLLCPSDVPEPRPTYGGLSKAFGAGKASSSENDPGPPTRLVQNARVRVFPSSIAGPTQAAMLDNSESRLPAPKTFGGLPKRLSGRQNHWLAFLDKLGVGGWANFRSDPRKQNLFLEKELLVTDLDGFSRVPIQIQGVGGGVRGTC
jgi:hypothetical protein